MVAEGEFAVMPARSDADCSGCLGEWAHDVVAWLSSESTGLLQTWLRGVRWLFLFKSFLVIDICFGCKTVNLCFSAERFVQIRICSLEVETLQNDHEAETQKF